METRRYPAVFAQWTHEAAHEGRARLTTPTVEAFPLAVGSERKSIRSQKRHIMESRIESTIMMSSSTAFS